MTKRITALTQPLVDILVTCDHAFLAQHNLTPGSWALVDTQQQEALLAAVSNTTSLTSGGSGSNSIACAGLLGIEGTCVCLAGNDIYGDTFQKDFASVGVTTALPLVPGARTGTCLSLITPDGERTMRTHLGVGVECDASHIHERDIENRSWIIFEGGHFLSGGDKNRAALFKAIEIASKKKTPIAFNISSEFAASNHRQEVIDKILPHTGLLIANESESIALSQEGTAEEAFAWLSSRCPGVAVTRGHEGALLSFGGKRAHIPAFTDITVIDSTGAGDAFLGALLAGLTHGLPLEAAGRGAARLAAAVVAQEGGRPKGEAVDAWKGSVSIQKL